MMKKTLATVLILGLLSGCAAQMRIDEMNKTIDEKRPLAVKCFLDLEQRDDTKYVRKHILHDWNTDNIESRLSLNSSIEKLNPEMKKHFKAYLIENEKCLVMWSDMYKQISPAVSEVFEQYRSARNVLLVDVFSGSINIGEFNRKYEPLTKTASDMVESRYTGIINELESENRMFLGAIASGLAGASHSYSQSMHQQRIEQNEAFKTIYKPAVTTNCSSNGYGGVRCVSQ